VKFLPALAAMAFLATSAACALEGPALPTWHGNKERLEMEAQGWVPGAILLTDESVPGEPPEPAASPLPVQPPLPEEIAEDSKQFPGVAEKFLPNYFAQRPKFFLVDPQALLSPSEHRDRLSFLNYHASDSSIDLFVYLLGGSQEIPSEVRQEEITERFFSEGRPAVIVFYYLGAPQRSVVYLSPSLMGSVSAVEQHRALESSVMQAFERTNPSEQLDKFLVQMSIRVYWMERMLATGSTSTAALPTVMPVTPGEKRAAVKSAKLIWLQETVSRFAAPTALGLAALMLVWGFKHWLRLRARYRFPEFEVEPRLGGAHAAGIGAVISFASAALPPASQRDQVPDYLRRA
jgi:hypothetical protein